MNILNKIIFRLLVVVTFVSNIILGQYDYQEVDTDFPGGGKYVAKLDQINVYTGERETIINLDDLNLHSWRPYVDDSGTKVFADIYIGDGLRMIDIENPTQQINLTRTFGHPGDERHCAAYNALTNKLYLAWTKIDDNIPDSLGGIAEYAEVVDPITGETIKEIEPFFGICGSIFSEDGQRIIALETPTAEDRAAGLFYYLIIDTNTDEIIERIPESIFGIGPNVTLTGNSADQLLVVNVIDNHREMYLFNLDTKEKSKSIVDVLGIAKLSLDNKYAIQAVISRDLDYNYNGEIWIHKITWPDDGNITPLEDGMHIQLPTTDIEYRITPIYTISNAPDVFMYQFNSNSDKYLIRIKDAKLIRINHRPIAQTFSVFATNSIWLKDSVNVKSGYVGVNDVSSGPFLNADVQLSIDNYTKTDKIEEVFANSIKVKNNAIVKGNVYTNSLVNNGKVKGTINNPFTFPVLNELPSFETATTDTVDITVLQDEIITLDPGNYDNLVVNIGGKVVFSGGIYNFNSIELKKNAKLRFAAISEVRVTGKLSTKSEAIIAPKTNAEITPADIVFYIAGINGDTGELTAEPKAAKIGTNSTVKANFYVPNGTLHIKADSNAKGAFFGKDVIIGKRTIVKIDSAWELEF